MFQTIVVLLSPFMQLGASYYLSIATLAGLIGLVAWWRPLFAGLTRSGFAIIIALFMPLSYWSGISLTPGTDLLRVAREGVMFIVLIAALVGFRKRGWTLPVPPYQLLMVMAAAYLLLTLAQTYYLAQGIYVGLPQQWYATDAQTLASDLDLLYNPNLRPHATFSEPSYFGFVMISIAMMASPLIYREKKALPIIILAVLAGLLSRSLAFFMSLFVVLLLPIALERGRNRVMLIGSALIVLTPVILFSGDGVLSRLSSATSADSADVSTSARLFGPLAALPGYLSAFPLGNPYSTIPQSLLPFLSRQTLDPVEILNNALFNLLFTYGVIGLGIIGAIIFYAKDLQIRLYLLTGAMFSGAFLAIDKVTIICLTLAIYEYGTSRTALASEAVRNQESGGVETSARSLDRVS